MVAVCATTISCESKGAKRHRESYMFWSNFVHVLYNNIMYARFEFSRPLHVRFYKRFKFFSALRIMCKCTSRHRFSVQLIVLSPTFPFIAFGAET